MTELHEEQSVSTGAVLRAKMGTLPLVGIIYFSVSGGPFGLEEAVGSSGAGMALLMLVVVPVVFAIPCALMSAELGTAMPIDGGYYYWVKAAFGRFPAFVQGAWSWLNTFLDTALYPIVFADYLAQWVPFFERGDHVAFSMWGGDLSFDAHWLLAIAFMIPLAWLNIRGSRLVGDTSLMMMVIVLAPFVITSVLGLWRLLDGESATIAQSFTLPDQTVFSSFGAALAVVIWNYIGWESPSTVLAEVDSPRRTYPKALLISIPLITISYVLPMIGALGSGLHHGDMSAWDDGDFANAANLLAGPWLKLFVTIAAVIAQVGLFSSLLMSGSRVPKVLAGDGYLPRWVARDHERHGTPAAAILLSCVVFAVFCALNFEALVDADVITNLAAILMEFGAFLMLRRKFPAMRRPYRVPGGWLVAWLLPLGPLVFTIWLGASAFNDEPAAFWIGLIILALGVLLYPLARRAWGGQSRGAVETEGIDFGAGIDPEAVLHDARPLVKTR